MATLAPNASSANISNVSDNEQDYFIPVATINLKERVDAALKGEGENITKLLEEIIRPENNETALVKRIIDELTHRAKTSGQMSHLAPVSMNLHRLIRLYPDFIVEHFQDLTYIPIQKEGVDYVFRSKDAEFYSTAGLPKYAKEDVDWKRRFFHSYMAPSHTYPRQLCTVPIINVCNYTDNSFNHPVSVFTDVVTAGNADIFGLPFWEAVLFFKWHKYARTRFYILWFIQCVNAILFSVAFNPLLDPDVSFSSQGQGWRVKLLCASIGISIVLCGMEIRKIIYYRVKYLWSFFNWLSLTSCIFTLCLSGSTIHNDMRGPSRFAAFAVLILWFNFISQCRVFKTIGIYSNVITSSAWGVRSFVLILLGIILAFSQALWTLWGTIPKSSTLPNNYYSDYVLSLKYTNYLLTGDATVADGYDSPDDSTGALIRSLFTIITSIFMLNILIALLNAEFSKALENSEKSWRLQFADIITTVEIFIMQPFERSNPELFPPLLFFEVKPDTIRKWNQEMSKR